MFRVIEGLPPGVLGLEAHGRITHADYRDVLIPKIEAAAVQGPIDMIYAFGEDFSGFEFWAMWDDAAAGIRHWKDFRRIAVVADPAWLRNSVSLFAPFIPAEVGIFTRAEMATARDWISRPSAS
ncbi:MAG TPA: STAS/SEC14 domain-containing protein [Rhodoblastus sp.]|nr:STAS/SEC14 domain-containing protein [Rhodoblastus sp.]